MRPKALIELSDDEAVAAAVMLPTVDARPHRRFLGPNRMSNLLKAHT
jgi:hypothetical protein